MLTANELGVAGLFLIPAALLSLQYGWDMVMDAFVPMSRTQIVRRLIAARRDDADQ